MRFRPGDRVTFDSTIYCGECDYCQRGEVNLCDNRQVIGVSCGEYRRAGAFAEYLVVPARIAYRLPANFSFAEAAMLEAVSVALHGVAVTADEGGDTVLVIGAGMIGLLLLQAARAAGRRARLRLRRRRHAPRTGSRHSAPTAPCRPPALAWSTRSCATPAARESTSSSKPSAARRPSPPPSTACARAEPSHWSATSPPQVTLPLQKVVSRQIRLQGSCASAGEYPQAIELIASGKIQVKPLITAVAPLREGARLVRASTRTRAQSDENHP